MSKTFEEHVAAFHAAERQRQAKALTAQTSTAKPDPLRCIHREDKGPSIGKATCAEGCVALDADGMPVPKMFPVRPCALYGKCVVAVTTKEGLKCCRDCKDRQEPHWPGPADPVGPRPPGWKTHAVTHAAHQRAADEFLSRWLQPYPGRYSGRGVVIAAGGRYWASAYVTIRMLRHAGCDLPVECWYVGGSGERDERYERLLAPFNVTFHDIDAHPARASRRVVQGFGTKLFAVVNSRFEEVLSLDPDNYPCADPTPLFAHAGYRKLGGIYWPDLEHTDHWTRWAAWGVARRGPCGLETGQYVLHKRAAWEPMRLAEWYDDHPDWCYGDGHGQVGLDYGDKGPHRAAWAKLHRDYVMFRHEPEHHPRLGFVQHGPNGTPLFVHRCHSKFVAEGAVSFPTTPQVGLNARGDLPGEAAAFGFLEELQAALRPVRLGSTSPATFTS